MHKEFSKISPETRTKMQKSQSTRTNLSIMNFKRGYLFMIHSTRLTRQNPRREWTDPVHIISVELNFHFCGGGFYAGSSRAIWALMIAPHSVKPGQNEVSRASGPVFVPTFLATPLEPNQRGAHKEREI